MPGSAVLDELLRRRLVDKNDIARVTGTKPRSVSRWTASGSVPRRDDEDRLLELKSVLDLLRQVLRDEPGRLWLRTPNPSLDWRKPLDLVAEGEYRKVVASLLALAEGVTA